MLSKLMKYEFKATARIFLLAYAVVIVLAGVNSAIIAINPPFGSNMSVVANIVSSLMMVIYVIAAIAMFIMTLAVIVVRFYRMLGDEGYLWFTLPATPTQHVLAKLIPAAVWTVASSIVATVSIGLVTLPSGWYSQAGSAWAQVASFGYNASALLSTFVVLILVALLMEVLMVYAAIAIGPNLVKSSRLGGSVLAFVILYVATQVLGLIAMGIWALMSKGLLSAIVSTVTAIPGGAEMNIDPSTFPAPLVNQAWFAFFSIFVVESLVVGVVSFLLTRRFIGRRLNLA